MAYRDDLDVALQRVDTLARREQELVTELEAARAGVPVAPPPLRHPFLLIALACALTFVGYVAVIALFDGSPPNPHAETTAARIGVAIPFIVSARIWWTRSLDRFWLGFFGARLLVLAIGLPVMSAKSLFGGDFVFFWWAPNLSVSVLLVELFVASRAPERRRPDAG